MLINKSSKNRLIIYFFFDKAGYADDYVRVMLKGLQDVANDIYVVSNGKLSSHAKELFGEFTKDILERENKGFDVWAYKEAMENIGWDKLESYDEVILMNYTIYGPVYPFSEMFDEMGSRDISFWGPTISHETDFDPFGTNPYGYLPDHIQTHFIAVRQDMMKSDLFHKYWENMPMIKSYQDSVGSHESYFTKYFADNGFKWDVYASSEEYRGLTYQPILMKATEMVRDQRCPIFKRRSFMHDYNVVLNESVGQITPELFKYIDKETDYDINLVWDNILRVENQADIKKNLQLNYVLPSNCLIDGDSNKKNPKVALIMHIYFVDLIPECVHYAASMPEYADIYITTNSEEKKQAIEKAFGELNVNKVDIRLVPNRGRDVAPFLVESRDYIYDYDIICHTHDKKVGQLKPGTVGQSFSYRCFENVLKTKEFVLNVLETFDNNPRMGIIMPPPPNHGDYFITLGLEWGPNFDVTKKLAEELGITAPMVKTKEPIAPLGSVFWARTDALRKIFDHEWKYEDFPEEPVADDGTVLHAIERMYNYSAQTMGYYPGWVMSESGAEMELTNMYFMLRTMNERLMHKYDIAGPFVDVISGMDEFVDFGKALVRAPKEIAGKLYVAGKGVDLGEKNAFEIVAENNDGMFEWTFDNLSDYESLNLLRFDPGEHGNVVVSDFKMDVVLVDGTVKTFNEKASSTNGIYGKKRVIFIENDPMLCYNILDSHVSKVHISAHIDRNIKQAIEQNISSASSKITNVTKKVFRRRK